MNSEANIKTGKTLFLTSFVIGTIIFLLDIFTNNNSLLILGYLFVLIALLLNFGMLITILINAGTDKINRKRLLKTAGLMVLNIPIALLYMQITSALMNIMIVTFINSTDSILTEIKIEGCENKEIQMLKPLERETLWIHLQNECQIDISYNLKNERKKENVIGYICSGLGQRTSYSIGRDRINK